MKLPMIDKTNSYVPFEPTDYVDNPIALARIKACITQKELAKRMNVTQAYISKIESQEKVVAKVLERVKKSLINKRIINYRKIMLYFRNE